MNIAFVGVGRMGANMARRLKDEGFHVTAVYDAHRAAATELAQELGSFASQSLGEVTAAADVDHHGRFRRRGDAPNLLRA